MCWWVALWASEKRYGLVCSVMGWWVALWVDGLDSRETRKGLHQLTGYLPGDASTFCRGSCTVPSVMGWWVKSYFKQIDLCDIHDRLGFLSNLEFDMHTPYHPTRFTHLSFSMITITIGNPM